MSMQNLFSAGIGLTLFIIALLLGKKNKGVSDYILIFWIAIFACNLFSFFLLNSDPETYGFFDFLIFEFSDASIFLHGPILWLYTTSLTDPSFKVKKEQGIHLIPFTIVLILLVRFLFQGQHVGHVFRNVLLAGKMIALLIYTLRSLQLLYAHKAIVEDVFSNVERKYLTWLSVIVWGILSVWVVAILSLVLDRFMGIQIPQYGWMFTNISICAFVYIIGYFGVKQPSLFVLHSTKSMHLKSRGGSKSKYQKSGLSPEEEVHVHQKAIRFMEDHKPYLDPELTLYTLAMKLQLQPNHLSQAINSQEKQNFFDFVNQFRIAEVKNMLRNGEKENLTLLGIAYDCGFNSKVSFNRTFKKLVGATPSEYKKKFR